VSGIAFVLVSYAPGTPAGMERATAALAGGLRSLAHHAIIITAAPQPRLDPNVIPLTALKVEFPADDTTLRNAISDAGSQLGEELAGILDRHRIETVVYVDALWGLGRAMADHPAHKVLAVHVIGHDKDLLPALARADRVIAPSPTVVRLAEDRGFPVEDWQVIPNSLLIESPPADPDRREELRRYGPVRIMARPAIEKGVVGLLDAVPTDLGRRAEIIVPSAPFEEVHGGQATLRLRCRRAAATTPCVQLREEALSWDQAPGWLAGAAVVIVPSHAETFGLVALEAMSAGTPVVAYDVGNLPELLATGGLIVERAEGPVGLWRAAASLTRDPLTYESTSRAAYYRSRDFRPASIADLFMKAVW
jgi:glycosyltransferase involved in cell wall biosynthesis